MEKEENTNTEPLGSTIECIATELNTTEVEVEYVKLTKEELTSGMTKRERAKITDELVDIVNNICEDPELAESYYDNWITYSSILSQGKYKGGDYVNAVKFVSFRLMDHNIIDSYTKTFPRKVAKWKVDGWAIKDINSQASRYSKSDLIIKMMTQTQLPVHIMHMDLFNKTILDLAMEGATARSDVARVSALTSVLQYTKPPENINIKMDVGVTHSGIDVLAELRNAATVLANSQLDSIKTGTKSAGQILEAKIINEVKSDGED